MFAEVCRLFAQDWKQWKKMYVVGRAVEGETDILYPKD